MTSEQPYAGLMELDELCHELRCGFSDLDSVPEQRRCQEVMTSAAHLLLDLWEKFQGEKRTNLPLVELLAKARAERDALQRSNAEKDEALREAEAAIIGESYFAALCAIRKALSHSSKQSND